MREKIIFVLRTDVHSGEYLTPQYWVQRRRTLADRILFFLCEEIQAVANSYEALSEGEGMVVTNHERWCGFEDCRDRILAMLKETSMSSQKEGQ